MTPQHKIVSLKLLYNLNSITTRTIKDLQRLSQKKEILEKIIKNIDLNKSMTDTQLTIMNNNYVKMRAHFYKSSYINFIKDYKEKDSYPYYFALNSLKENDLLCALIFYHIDNKYRDPRWANTELKESSASYLNRNNVKDDMGLIDRILNRKLTSAEYEGYVTGSIPIDIGNETIDAGLEKAEFAFKYYQEFYINFPGISKSKETKRH